MRPEIKLVVSDVDGTLVTSEKELTNRVISAAHRLHDAGIRLMITSSRPPRGLEWLIEPLDLRDPIAPFNGGMFLSPNLDVLREQRVPDDAVPELAEVLSSVCLDVWAYTRWEWLITDPAAPHVARETNTLGFEPQVVSSIAGATEVMKMVGVHDDPRMIAVAQESVRDTLGDVVSATTSQTYYLDITSTAANKGAVVDYAVEAMGIDAASVMVIGDMPSDVAMFEKAGLSVAMGNADPAVKALADEATASNNDDGFAIAVERLVLDQHEPMKPGGSHDK